MKKTPFKRSGRIKPKKRSAVEFARVYGSKARVEWVKAQTCVADCFCDGYSVENHHVENGGRGRKADARFIVPLCTEHHRLLHQWGRREFERVFFVDLAAQAALTEARWQAHSGAAA